MNGQRIEIEDCAAFLKKLDAYIDGEMNDREALEFRAHADKCAACGAELSAAELLSSELIKLDEGVVMPLSGQAAWRSAAREMASRRKSGGSVVRALISVAASLAVLVCGTAYLRAGNYIAPNYRVRDEGVQTANIGAGVVDGEPGSRSMFADSWLSGYVETDGELSGDEERGTVGEDQQKMLIRRAERTMNTKDFDGDAENMRDLVSEYGGYFIESRVDGAAADGARIGNYTARIPARQLSDFLTALSGVGETVAESESAEDIISEYGDVEARLLTLDAQLSRLDDLLNQADALSDIIAIEEKMAEIQGEASRLEAMRSGFAGEHDEPKVFITLAERVAPQEGASLKERMSGGFAASRIWFFGFLRDMAVALAYAGPVLIVAIPLLIIVGVAVRRNGRKYR